MVERFGLLMCRMEKMMHLEVLEGGISVIFVMSLALRLLGLATSEVANSGFREVLVELLDFALLPRNCYSGEMVTEIERWFRAGAD